ncbi:hypothetical protein FNJ87_20640, partial [Nonlabens mediterrranea]|nr:hypothetical protein [Nonlabens mediterrranea]
MKLYHLLFAFLIIPFLSFAQESNAAGTITISGTLVDKSTKTPLEFATVSLLSTNPGSTPQGE